MFVFLVARFWHERIKHRLSPGDEPQISADAEIGLLNSYFRYPTPFLVMPLNQKDPQPEGKRFPIFTAVRGRHETTPHLLRSPHGLTPVADWRNDPGSNHGNGRVKFHLCGRIPYAHCVPASHMLDLPPTAEILKVRVQITFWRNDLS